LKKKIIILLSLLICIMLMVTLFTQNKLQKQIINYIDEESGDNDSCIVVMKDITGFVWDKMLIYQVGSSNGAISDILNVTFNDTVDLKSGILFVKDNKIVYKESMEYNPEKPGELTFYIGKLYGEEEYVVYTPEDAIFRGEKVKNGSEILYQVKPYND